MYEVRKTAAGIVSVSVMCTNAELTGIRRLGIRIGRSTISSSGWFGIYRTWRVVKN